jgi:hypothetical protein
MRLSTIIPIYKRPEQAIRHVKELFNCTRLPDEIIIVNDGGDKSVEGKFPQSVAGVKVIYAYIEEDILWNYNGAVNLGCWLSTGDILAIEDCDHVPNRNAYLNAMQIFENEPDIDRVQFSRNIIQLKDFDKPMSEWKSNGFIGSNQMVAMLRRDVYLRLKGQDERMCGYYGYMAYDFPYRRDKILKIKSKKSGEFYWAVFGDEGEPGLVRGLSRHNRAIYHENVIANKLHSMHGILNFHYKYEVL